MIGWFDSLKEIPRLRKIGGILFRHGFGHIASNSHFEF